MWKNYTIPVVNLTAAKEGKYLGCNHGSTVIGDPIDEIAARWGRERRLSAPGTPHATIALNGFQPCALRHLAERLEQGRTRKVEDPPFPVLTLTTHGDHPPMVRSVLVAFLEDHLDAGRTLGWVLASLILVAFRGFWIDRRVPSRRAQVVGIFLNRVLFFSGGSSEARTAQASFKLSLSLVRSAAKNAVTAASRITKVTWFIIVR